MRVAVTGARGFVGPFVVSALRQKGADVVALERSPSSAPASGVAVERVARATDSEAALRTVLRGVDVVVHLAALVHDVHGHVPAAAYLLVNRDYTLRLARAAASAGAGRFVFLSSIKVNGAENPSDAPLSEASPVLPGDVYASSKWEAERGLLELSGELSTVSLRCPLVYGPGVRANFERLMLAVMRRRPLPFGSIQNRRSLLYVENLADVVSELALVHAGASTYLVSDGEDLSTPELVRRLGRALGVTPRLLDVPEPLLRLSLRVLGKRDVVPRLLGSLTVDPSRLRRELGWAPPLSVSEGLSRTAAWYRGAR